LTVGVVEMGVEDLFGVGERPVQPRTDDSKVLVHLLVVDVVALLPIAHFDLLAEVGSIADSRQATAASLDTCQYGQ
jgi:hypothetical protein